MTGFRRGSSDLKGDSKWITGEDSRYIVHKVRNSLSGIMAGIGTILKDDPLLTTRIEKGRSPKAIIVDSNLKIPIESKILKTLGEREIYIACIKEHSNLEKKKALEEKGVNIIELPANEKKQVPLKALMKILGERGIDSILLEGGGTLNFSALQENIVDKVMCFIAPKIIGGEKSKSMIAGEGIEKLKDSFYIKDETIEKIGEDILITGYIEKLQSCNKI